MAEKDEGKGRRKIHMKRIESEDDRLITFSKRRIGIYKKATEISTLCGADIGVLIFSPAGNPFAYGIPNIESISDRLLRRQSHQRQLSGRGMAALEGHRRSRLEELNRSTDELNAYLQTLTKEGERLVEQRKKKVVEGGGEAASCWWWDIPVEDLKAEEMDHTTSTMEQIHKNASLRLRDLFGAAFHPQVGFPNPSSGLGLGDGDGY